MKVLFATSWFPSSINPTNGNFVERHLNAVTSVGHEVVVAHIEVSHRVVKPRIERRKIGTAEVFQLFVPRSLNGVSAFRNKMFRKLWTEISESGFQPDIIHGHVFYPISEFIGHVKNLVNVPLVFTEHWSGYREVNADRYTPEVESIIKQGVAKTDRILPVSNDLVDVMKGKGLSGTYEVVNNAVDAQLFFPAPQKNEQFTFLHISNFDKRSKNTEGIISAFAKMQRQDCKLVIAGDGDLNQLKGFADANGIALDNIELIGTLSYEEVARTMQASDCHVLFSNFENLPCVIAESHCCGVPVIATNVGGIPEMVDESNGILVEPKDESALQKAMEAMLEKNRSYLLTDISKAAIARYSYQSIGNRFTEVYDAVTVELAP